MSGNMNFAGVPESNHSLDHIVQKILSGSSGPSFLDKLYEETGAPLLLLTYDQRPIASIDFPLSHDDLIALRRNIQQALAKNHVDYDSLSPGPLILKDGTGLFLIQSFERLHGFLVTVYNFEQETYDSPNMELFRQTVWAIALRFLYIHATESVEKRYRTGFVQDLLFGRFQNDEHARLRGKTIGIDLDVPIRTVLLGVKPPQPEWDGKKRAKTSFLQQFIPELEAAASLSNIEIWSAPTDSGVGMLLPERTHDKPLIPCQRLLEKISNKYASFTFRMSISQVANAPSDIPKGFQEARTALLLGSRLFPDLRIYEYSTLGAYRALSHMSQEAFDFYKEQLSLLEEYDQKSSAGLLETLRTFFACNLNRKECAKSMFLHTNTVVYRLKKIEELTGHSLKNFNHCFNLQLALIIRDLHEIS